MDLAESSGLLKLIDKNLKICIGKQWWTDREILFSLIMLNLMGGDCVRDIEFACGFLEGVCIVGEYENYCVKLYILTTDL
ncbi:MAG: hypothetical protein HQK88_15715 [Nitrospirae bacterium]|nr:hypothetical protein [Nitrospirota bacterium]MBF0536308.1 hypothetical protein [Nitrospirota bacterium]MBF0618249.1 hypothetical protein [Nitrospirota bacterium]